MTRMRSDRRGQALVEFALAAPIFLFLMFAIIDFGRYVYYVQILNNAAREGARYAIVHGANGIPSSGPPASGTTSSDPSGANVKAVVRNYLTGVIGSGSTTTTDVQVCWLNRPAGTLPRCAGNNGREYSVEVTVDYQFRSVIPIVPIPAVQIQGASTLVINN
jgi:Flp pilus assembly protein TadG